MTAASGTASGPVGRPDDRRDAVAKVTGRVAFPADATVGQMLHAVAVVSTVAAGRVRSVDTVAAEKVAGVRAVYTHLDAPRIAAGPDTMLGPPARPALQDDRIHFHGQLVGLVVAEHPEQAREAASHVRLEVDRTPAVLRLEDGEPTTHPAQDSVGQEGDADAEIERSPHVYEESFETAATSNTPIGLFSTLAAWDADGGRLTVWDSTQWPSMVRDHLAQALDVARDDVRVLCPHLGGGFGAGLRAWSHVALVAAVARDLGAPVRLTLTRAQMFTLLGHRIQTHQTVRAGYRPDGYVTALRHDTLGLSSVVGAPLAPPPSFAALAAYATPHLARTDRLVAAHVSEDGAMRAPGTAEGQFATETAIDEIAHRLGLDPLVLRRTNHAATHPYSGLPWSSNELLRCYERGAELIGWEHRPPVPGGHRDGPWLLGWGVAGVSFDRYVLASSARVTLREDGTALVQSSGTDIGTGLYTVLAQVAAAELGLPTSRVEVELGDSDLPEAAQAGGSALTTSLGWAVVRACRQASERRRENGGGVAVGEGRVEFMEAARDDVHPAGAFAAKFAQVAVDPDLGLVRLRRLVSVVDAGTVLNEKLARSQVLGGTVMGVGQALLEAVERDPRDGSITNRNLADYAIPVSADVPSLEVELVGGPDPASPVGSKGLGEIGVSAVAPAVGNAVFNATGVRLRSLPLRLAPRR